MGRLALSHEIDRARRSDGRFVLAFVDVDRLKTINDRDGHAAGDRVLQTVVRAIRTRLRSFDPIVRYGGDEFVCGLTGTDLADAERRFEAIGIAIEAEARVGISVGFAALAAGDTADLLTERADAAMLEVSPGTTHRTGTASAARERCDQLVELVGRQLTGQATGHVPIGVDRDPVRECGQAIGRRDLPIAIHDDAGQFASHASGG